MTSSVQEKHNWQFSNIDQSSDHWLSSGTAGDLIKGRRFIFWDWVWRTLIGKMFLRLLHKIKCFFFFFWIKFSVLVHAIEITRGTLMDPEVSWMPSPHVSISGLVPSLMYCRSYPYFSLSTSESNASCYSREHTSKTDTEEKKVIVE